MAALSLMIYQTAWSKLGMFASQGSPLAKELALCTLQFCGNVGTAQLAKLTPSLELQYKHPVTEEVDLVSISAETSLSFIDLNSLVYEYNLKILALAVYLISLRD
ncbi:hypothetical protein EB796_013443 [Bugula neritina]|uniref:Uncharacterized protein n=1 Tax=Bugula neritina TaxID=10212 RepID=A0A7J7JPI0_BUGNE|nr:hypothetical protein EB796_013443 [Bugula neritina]